MWDYQARPVRVVDGDNVRMMMDRGRATYTEDSIRLAGVKAPPSTTPGGVDATRQVAQWLIDHASHRDGVARWPFVVVTQRVEGSDRDRMSFERYVGTITCRACGESLNETLREFGYSAVPVIGGPGDPLA